MVLDAIAADLAGHVGFVKVNVDEHAELVARYDVRSTPTLFVFRNGAVVGDPLVGAHPEATVRQMITAALASSSTPRADNLLAWVPVDACTLPTAEQPFRLAEFTALFAESLRAIERPDWTQLRLVIDAAAEERARDLAARESSCCSFFTFDFQPDADGQVWMQVGVPAERVSVLDGLAAQAAAASGVAESLAEVADMVEAAHPPSHRMSKGLHELAQAKLADVQARIADLQVISEALQAAVDAGCNDLIDCAGDPACPLPFPELARHHDSTAPLLSTP